MILLIYLEGGVTVIKQQFEALGESSGLGLPFVFLIEKVSCSASIPLFFKMRKSYLELVNGNLLGNKIRRIKLEFTQATILTWSYNNAKAEKDYICKCFPGQLINSFQFHECYVHRDLVISNISGYKGLCTYLPDINDNIINTHMMWFRYI